MNLYFIDSKGAKKLIASGIKDENQAIHNMLEHDKRLFIHWSGSFKALKKETKTEFINSETGEVRYVLE